jgi:hypothetical protein
LYDSFCARAAPTVVDRGSLHRALITFTVQSRWRETPICTGDRIHVQSGKPADGSSRRIRPWKMPSVTVLPTPFTEMTYFVFLTTRTTRNKAKSVDQKSTLTEINRHSYKSVGSQHSKMDALIRIEVWGPTLLS